MTWMNAMWFAAGGLLGLAHVMGLGRSARRGMSSGPLVGMLRLTVVGAGLALMASAGGAVPAAGGWAAGFLVGFAAALARWPRVDRRRDRP